MSPNQIWEKIQKGVFIIAEAGKNFIQSPEDLPVSGYLANAKDLVDKAAWAGADAIKFQTHSVEDEQHPDIRIPAAHFPDMDRLSWVTKNTKATPVNEFWRPLKAYCEEKGIVFFSTPMGRGAAARLNETGVPLWKIGSGDILDYVMLDYVRRTSLPVIMSSGASSFDEVFNALMYLSAKNPRIALMHALSKYPGKPEEANLNVLETYRGIFGRYGIPIGFSENSIGIEPSLIAVTMGATVIEKHFTTDRGLWGADHKVCSTPPEFKEMVDEIRLMDNSPSAKRRWQNYPSITAIRGTGIKELMDDEKIFRPVFQKALAASRDLPSGAVITSDMVYALRHRSLLNGLPSERYEEVLGKRLGRPLKKYDPITEDALVD